MKTSGLHLMLGHEARKCGPVCIIKLLLHMASFSRVEPKQVLDKGRHTLINLREQIALGRIERVVEIENPKPRVRERLPNCAGSACRFR